MSLEKLYFDEKTLSFMEVHDPISSFKGFNLLWIHHLKLEGAYERLVCCFPYRFKNPKSSYERILMAPTARDWIPCRVLTWALLRLDQQVWRRLDCLSDPRLRNPWLSIDSCVYLRCRCLNFYLLSLRKVLGYFLLFQS